jgi:hypothetical protein
VHQHLFHAGFVLALSPSFIMKASLLHSCPDTACSNSKDAISTPRVAAAAAALHQKESYNECLVPSQTHTFLPFMRTRQCPEKCQVRLLNTPVFAAAVKDEGVISEAVSTKWLVLPESLCNATQIRLRHEQRLRPVSPQGVAAALHSVVGR